MTTYPDRVLHLKRLRQKWVDDLDLLQQIDDEQALHQAEAIFDLETLIRRLEIDVAGLTYALPERAVSPDLLSLGA